MGRSQMVRQRPLTPPLQVRVLAPQQSKREGNRCLDIKT